MKAANRINLIPCVRNALRERELSTVNIVNAVNAALGELTCVNDSDEGKTGASSCNAKKGKFKVSVSALYKYEGKLTVPLLFDSWHSAMEKANKVAEMENCTIPAIFNEWLAKFKVPAPEPAAS